MPMSLNDCLNRCAFFLERVVDLLVEQLGGLVVDVGVRAVGAVRLRVKLVEQLRQHLEVLQVEASKSSLRPARCTLTATGLPWYVALCTWPRERRRWAPSRTSRRAR